MPSTGPWFRELLGLSLRRIPSPQGSTQAKLSKALRGEDGTSHHFYIFFTWLLGRGCDSEISPPQQHPEGTQDRQPRGPGQRKGAGWHRAASATTRYDPGLGGPGEHHQVSGSAGGPDGSHAPPPPFLQPSDVSGRAAMASSGPLAPRHPPHSNRLRYC